MAKDEMLKVLKDSFKDFKFYEDGHYYTYKDKPVGISVTKFIAEYENEFNQQEVAEKVLEKNLTKYNKAQQMIKHFPSDDENAWAYESELEQYLEDLKLPITIEDILAEWKYKADFACRKGSVCHLYAQSLWNGERAELYEWNEQQKFINAVDKIVNQANNFFDDYEDKLEHLQDELVVGSAEYDIASAVDHLFYNKLTGGLVLVDYKTNSYMSGYNKKAYSKKMLPPLDHINDDALHHYYIQLSIYKFLIEKYTGLKVDEMFIVYMSENIENYEIIEIPYLKEEVKKILELRKVNKMARMLLVIGEGGSGKTASLKNLNPQEHYYIDCDKKGLNYRGWKEDYSEEKKNYFKTNDGEVVSRLLQNISEKAPNIKYITIDTINSIMVADEMKRMKGKSYNEWQDLAKCIFDIIDIVPDLREDLTVIFIGHTQTEEDGFTRLLTNGRKLNKIGLEKYFNTVLLSKALNGKYIFETRANNSTARTPMGAFEELEIENDIVKVLEVLKEY